MRRSLPTFALILVVAINAFADFTVADGEIHTTIDGEEIVVGYMVRNDDMFAGFDFSYAISPDSTAIAYIGEDDVGYCLYVYDLETEILVHTGIGEGFSGRSRPVWSPNSYEFAVSVGNRIWIYDRYSAEMWLPVDPDEEWLEDIDPSFSPDGSILYFYRGSTFEFSFSGELHAHDLVTGEVWLEPEEEPRYPGEHLGEYDGPPYSEYDFWMDAAYEKAARFADDLVNHDHYGLFLALDMEYAVVQLEIMGEYPVWMTVDVLNSLLFNGAVMYGDYSNTIQSLLDIESIVSYYIDDLEETVVYTVGLSDGREVTFWLFVDFGDLDFYGPYG